MKWTQQKEKAAAILAQGGISVREVARVIGCNKGTIALWKTEHEFQARVDQYVEEFGKSFAETCAKICQARAEARLKLLEKIASVVDQITLEELEAIKKSPTTAIGLLMRLEQAVEATLPRKTKSYEQEELQDDFPFHEGINHESAQKILEFLQSRRSNPSPQPHPQA